MSTAKDTAKIAEGIKECLGLLVLARRLQDAGSLRQCPTLQDGFPESGLEEVKTPKICPQVVEKQKQIVIRGCSSPPRSRFCDAVITPRYHNSI